jgi:BirA family biotin operon repressor/biotin-[acetyl-CoA-carboxylase] ligase
MTLEPTIDAVKLAAAVQTQRIGRTVRMLAETSSTNDVCWEHLNQVGTAGDGFVVLADYQTAGRGRFARQWQAPRASSILLSTLIIQAREPLRVERLSLIAGIAACTAARQVSDAPIQLRWPNDLVCQRKKVGGVLVESRPMDPGRIAAVIGIGINCLQQRGHFPASLRDKTASLDVVSTGAISREDLAVNLIRQLDHWLADSALPSAESVGVEWQKLAEPLGQRVCLVHAGRRLYGTTIELDPTGGLLVQLESGGRRIFDPSTTTMEVPEPEGGQATDNVTM